MSAETTTIEKQASEQIKPEQNYPTSETSLELGKFVLDSVTDNTSGTNSVYAQRARELAQPLGRQGETVSHLDPHGIAEYLRVSPELAEAGIEQAEIRMPLGRSAIRISSDDFFKVLRDGKFKSVSETGMSTGNGRVNGTDRYIVQREAFESERGLIVSPDEPKPIYGFLEEIDEIEYRPNAPQYGQVEVILKPEVTERSVYTLGDSMRHRNPQIGFGDAMVAKQVLDFKDQTLGHGFEYIESQIMGGVSLEDIEKVVVNLTDIDDGATEYFGDMFTLLSSNVPDAQVIVRFPVNKAVPPNVLFELCKNYPNLQFVGCSELEHKPPSQQNPLHHDIELLSSSISESKADLAKRRARKEHVDEKLKEYWRKSHPEEEYPQNLKIVLSLANRGKY